MGGRTHCRVGSVNSDLLRECAAAYGGTTRLSRAVGVDDSLMRRWLSGARPLPDWLPARLAEVLRDAAADRRAQAARCEQLSRTLRERAAVAG